MMPQRSNLEKFLSRLDQSLVSGKIILLLKLTNNLLLWPALLMDLRTGQLPLDKNFYKHTYLNSDRNISELKISNNINGYSSKNNGQEFCLVSYHRFSISFISS